MPHDDKAKYPLTPAEEAFWITSKGALEAEVDLIRLGLQAMKNESLPLDKIAQNSGRLTPSFALLEEFSTILRDPESVDRITRKIIREKAIKNLTLRDPTMVKHHELGFSKSAKAAAAGYLNEQRSLHISRLPTVHEEGVLPDSPPRTPPPSPPPSPSAGIKKP